MSDIHVVMFLVRCSQSLLLCDDINTEHLRFETMDACRSEMPGLLEAARRSSLTNHVFMGRCHYLTKSGARKPAEVRRDATTEFPRQEARSR